LVGCDLEETSGSVVDGAMKDFVPKPSAIFNLNTNIKTEEGRVRNLVLGRGIFLSPSTPGPI